MTTTRRCSFAFPGTYGHECGDTATVVAVFPSERTKSGFYFGGRCDRHAHVTSRLFFVWTITFASNRPGGVWTITFASNLIFAAQPRFPRFLRHLPLPPLPVPRAPRK